MNELLVLLLPLAAFSGWWLARADKKTDKYQKEDDYFKGLSYLLEDEADKAIDIFFRIAHLDDSTIENQITLGNLFRHRGEIDRALHIHVSLSDNATLSNETRQKLNLALGDDYLVAGIMNHAEESFQAARASSFPDIREIARRKLVLLYAEQRQWKNAIAIAEELDPFKNSPIQKQVAHYHCEIAESLPKERHLLAESEYQQALVCDNNCVRATIALGRIAKENQRMIAAIEHFKHVEVQNVAFLPEILDDMKDCYHNLNQTHEWKEMLVMLVEKYHNPVLVLYLNQLITEQDGPEAAQQFLQERLQSHPNMLALQAYLGVADTGEDTAIHLVNESVNKILGIALKYRCCECGFRGNRLNWKCPGCKNWGTFTPISDISVKENI